MRQTSPIIIIIPVDIVVMSIITVTPVRLPLIFGDGAA